MHGVSVDMRLTVRATLGIDVAGTVQARTRSGGVDTAD